MTSKIRWGILATGGIAADFTRDLQLLARGGEGGPGGEDGLDAEVVAVGSRSEESARAFADRFSIPRAHGSWAALAADPGVDVVYVATPHHAHREAAALCLAAGRAVLCEKPLTLDAAGARELAALAGERGALLMEGMWMRYSPAIRRIAELLAEGAIGQVATLHADFGLPGPFPLSHRLRDPGLGGGALLDLGVYPVTLAQLLLGRPDRVQAWAQLTPEGVDAQTGLLLGYERGAVATLSCGITAGTACRAVVSGSLGRIELPPIHQRPDSFTLHRPGHAPELFRMPRVGGVGFVHEIREAGRCLRAGETQSPLAPWDATVQVLDLLDEVRARIGVRYPVGSVAGVG